MKAYFASPISDQFNESYGQSGLQPSVGGVSRAKNVNIEYKNDPSIRRGGKDARGQALSASATSVEYSGAKGAGNTANVNSAPRQNNVRLATVDGEYAKPVQLQPRRDTYVAPVKKKAKKKGLAGSAVVTVKNTARRARAVASTITIWSWGMFLWITFQLPLAVISIIFLAINQMIFELYTTLTVSTAEDGLLVTAAKYVGNLIATTLGSIYELLNAILIKTMGIDLNFLNPAGLFMATHLAVMALGWVTLLTAAVVYSMSGSKPIFGGGGGTKALFFLLAMVAYAIPIMNLFPWFILWTLAVIKNPK